MAELKLDISMSLDGFIAGPNPSREQPLGEGGERLHEWAFGLASWRERHGKPGGDANVDSEVLEETMAGTGANVMGKGMFGGGEGPWGDEPWEGWWGDDPPFDTPVFVLTHHPREPLKKGSTTFTFVSDGIESALEQAREAAGDRDVVLGGGASVAQQYMKAGLLDELQFHVVPVLMGEGIRLFEGHLDGDLAELECMRVIDSPEVTHLRYRVRRSQP